MVQRKLTFSHPTQRNWGFFKCSVRAPQGSANSLGKLAKLGDFKYEDQFSDWKQYRRVFTVERRIEWHLASAAEGWEFVVFG